MALQNSAVFGAIAKEVTFFKFDLENGDKYIAYLAEDCPSVIPCRRANLSKNNPSMQVQLFWSNSKNSEISKV